MPSASPIAPKPSAEVAGALWNIRLRILELSNRAKSAHVGSALSCVEIVYTAMLARKQQSPAIEKILFSKGHAAMCLYATAENLGLLPSKELESYLADGSSLWGHPSMSSKFPFIDWSTGSLGHGLPAATGFAFSRKKFKQPGKGLVVAILSDGECNEGSVWEAALFAGHHGLGNLVAIIDYNKIQSFGKCADVIGLDPFAEKWRQFGWQAHDCDGHDTVALSQLLSDQASDLSRSGSKPLCIVAHTIKGRGVADIENTVASHYKPISDAQLAEFKKHRP